MHMMDEIHRILKPGGYLVLTTPNIASARSIAAVLQGFHPQLFSTYLRPKDGETDARHHREYTATEIRQLLENSGFEVRFWRPARSATSPNLSLHGSIICSTAICYRRNIAAME